MDGKELSKRLAENIKKYRAKENLTQSKLYDKSGVTEVTIKKVETCNQWPSPEKIAAIATALNVDVYELFLPVPSSFEIEQSIKEKVLATAKQSFEEFLDSVKGQV